MFYQCCEKTDQSTCNRLAAIAFEHSHEVKFKWLSFLVSKLTFIDCDIDDYLSNLTCKSVVHTYESRDMNHPQKQH